jgi:hypothetical protein
MGKDTEMRNEVRSIARKAWLASRGRSWAEPLRQTTKTLFSLTKQFHSTEGRVGSNTGSTAAQWSWMGACIQQSRVAEGS